MVKDKCKWIDGKDSSTLIDEYERELIRFSHYKKKCVAYHMFGGSLRFLINENLINKLPIHDAKKYIETQIEIFVELIT